MHTFFFPLGRMVFRKTHRITVHSFFEQTIGTQQAAFITVHLHSAIGFQMRAFALQSALCYTYCLLAVVLVLRMGCWVASGCTVLLLLFVVSAMMA